MSWMSVIQGKTGFIPLLLVLHTGAQITLKIRSEVLLYFGDVRHTSSINVKIHIPSMELPSCVRGDV